MTEDATRRQVSSRVRAVLHCEPGEFQIIRHASRETWEEFSRRMKQLTDKERSTLSLLVTGAPNKTMAAQLEVSERAVEVRRASIMKKLGVKTFAEMVRQVTHYELLFPN